MSSVHLQTKKFKFDICNKTDRFTKQKLSLELFEISAAYLKE